MKSILTIVLLFINGIMIKSKTIYLIRHGTTLYNTSSAKRIRGRSNISLNDDGKKQAEILGRFLSKDNIGNIYYSPIKRTKETAEIIKKYNDNDSNIKENNLIIEIYFGEWEGKKQDEIFKGKNNEWYIMPNSVIIPNGENLYQVLDRLNKFLINFWESNEDIITIVTHGGITSLLSLIFMGNTINKFWVMYMENGSLSKIYMNNIGDYKIDYWNLKYNEIINFINDDKSNLRK